MTTPKLCKTCHNPASERNPVTDDWECITCMVKRLNEKAGLTEKFFLQYGEQPEVEVTKEEWVRAERAAGFYNTMGRSEEPATGGFSNGNVHGRAEYFAKKED